MRDGGVERVNHALTLSILLTASEPLRRRIIVGFPRFRVYDLIAASSCDRVQAEKDR